MSDRVENPNVGADSAVMPRSGLSTILFSGLPVRPSPAEMLIFFGQAGIQYVDWTHDLYDNRTYPLAEMDEFAERLAANGLRCQQVHGFGIAEVHPLSEGAALDRYVEVVSNRIELCARLGGDTLVVHMPGVFWRHLSLSMAEALERSTRAIDRLRSLCARLGITLAVENIGSAVSPAIDDRAALDFYFDRYPADFITFCLDVGHAHVTGNLEELKGYASRLKALHLHDNHGQEDEHLPPFDGTIDWPGTMGWLADIGYSRALSFEIQQKPDLYPIPHAEFAVHALGRVRQALRLSTAGGSRQTTTG